MIIRKDDILGKRVKCVFQTPPFTHTTPGEISITTIELYVELEDGTLFGFSYPDDRPPPIRAIDRSGLMLLPADFGMSPPRPCVGEEALEIAFCDYWSHMAVLVSSGRFITLAIGLRTPWPLLLDVCWKGDTPLRPATTFSARFVVRHPAANRSRCI